MGPFCPLLSLFLCLYARAEMNTSLSQPPITALIANASAQLSLNTSSTSISEFSYIIPYNKTQDCNIYGPICQTGSITVDVNLTTAITTTVLPCSSYLSAQSSYLGDLNPMGCFQESYGAEDDPLVNWQTNFGESQECRSYANAIDERQQTISYPVSDCGSNTTVIQAGVAGFDSPWPIPPGVNQFRCDDHTFTCCGNCSYKIPQVRLYYFPDKNDVDCQNNQKSNLTSATSAPIQKRVHSLVADKSTAVVSGNTFTSPSLYLEVIGTASVVDECITFGPKLVNPIITLSPGALSTWQPPHEQFYTNYDYFMIGARWIDPGDLGDLSPGEEDGISPLDVKDLACPTWGLGQSLSAGTTVLTIGPPWLPLIVPPIEILSLDPIWASACTAMYTGANGFTTFAIFDPPIALTPSAWLVDPMPAPVAAPADPTTMSEQTTLSAQTAKPVSPPNPATPASKTRDSGREPTPSPVVASADTVGSITPHDSSTRSTAYPGIKGDPPADPPSDPKVPLVVGDPPARDPNKPSPKSLDPPAGDLHTLSPNTNPPATPVPQQAWKSQMQTQGLGAVIYNAFGKSGPDNSPTNDDDNDDNNDDHVVDGSPITQDTLTIAGQEVAVDPSGMVIGGSSLLPGGSAVTISNTPISLGSSGILVVGSSTILLPTPLDPPSTPFATKAFTVAGQTFTPDPSAFSIAGTTVIAGGSAVTISNTPISLGSSGILVVGSSTILLPTPLDPPSTPFAAKVLTVAGQTVTANAFAFPIAGTTLSAGGPAVTISGTVVSLGPSGALVIGSSTVPLLPTYTIAGQTFTLVSSGIAIAGTTISAGGPAVTVDGTIISVQPSGTLIVGSSTIPLLISQSTISSDVNIDGLNVEVEAAFAVVDGVTVSPGAAGVTISGEIVSLEAGGETLDAGTGRFALPPMRTGGANGSINVQAFTGGQSGGLRSSLFLLCGFYGTLVLLLM